LAQAAEAEWRWLLVIAWLFSVVGLIALTVSYHAAGHHISRRRQQIYENSAEDPTSVALLNGVALWSFPAALVSTFVFAMINILS
jgi:heme/copper-type cytochrome/quinol oxidase subunit 2